MRLTRVSLEIVGTALLGVAQWVRRRPANRKFAGPIPGQGTCLGFRPGPRLGACERLIDVSLPPFPLPSVLLTINK